MIKQLTLSNYRNYDSARLITDHSFVQITGLNGAGKTNILEALSYLSPGRGLRGSDLSDVTYQAYHHSQGWSVVAELGDGVKLQTGFDNRHKKRHIHINGHSSAQSHLSDYIAVSWLTPQMDGLFLASASERRRFFDRMAYLLDPAHAGRLSRYEKALRQRNRLLKQQQKHLVWYDGLEKILAETAVAIAATRIDLLDQLNLQLEHMNLVKFVKPRVDFSHTSVEQKLRITSAAQVEQDLLNYYHDNRELDQEIGGTSAGIHKTDFMTTHVIKNILATQCSTGEQKAMLISLILAQADLAQKKRERPLIILLDDVAAHLDRHRQSALIDYLQGKVLQCWMTGVEPFENIKNSLHCTVCDGVLSQQG